MADHIPNGFLLVIEGIDGAGKSTQAQRVAESLRARGFDVVLSREPTNGPWGKLLRESATTGRLSPESELEAFIKDRKEHVEHLIRPSLAAGKVVILDRYYFSTAAYQGARGFDPETIIRTNEAFAPEPDLLVIMDIDPASGHGRIHARGDAANQFETDQTLTKARAIFQSFDRPYVFRLDASRPINEITACILQKLQAAMSDQTNAGGSGPEAKEPGLPDRS